MFEVHSPNQAAVIEAGNVVLDRLGLRVADRIKPQVVSTQVITRVDPYQAQLLNRFRRGSMLVAGETMLVLECAPAAYINIACNEAEKTASIKLIHVSSVGRFGRMWLSGTEAEIMTARDAAIRALESLEGRPEAEQSRKGADHAERILYRTRYRGHGQARHPVAAGQR